MARLPIRSGLSSRNWTPERRTWLFLANMDRLVVTAGELQNLPFVIDDTAGLTIGQLHTRMVSFASAASS